VLPTETAPAATLPQPGQSAANNVITSTVSSDNQGEQSANHNHNEQYNNNKVIII
jgi:hypothetical protein